MGDYLFDKTEPPDPEVERLERLLGPYRYRGAAARRPRRRWIVAGAAAAVAAAVALWLGLRPRAERWTVEALAGTPRCADGPCAGLGPGDALVTDARSRARLVLGQVGRLDVEPGTLVRRRPSDASYRLALVHGEVRAEVSAPPRLLVIDTASATAVDLGCAYTLAVDERGEGWLRVGAGWVALEASSSRTVFVPRGAEAALHAGAAPGTPRFGDAPAELRAALDRLDAALAAGAVDAGALAAALAASRAPDTLSLFNLLARLPAADRAGVVERMLALGAPLPATIPRAAVLAADADALERWRHALSAIWL